MKCNICNSEEIELIYKSNDGSISSICELNKNNIYIYFCNNCTHVFTDFKMDCANYYNNDYNILTQSEDEDQLYKIVDNKNIYRTEHQANLLINEFDLTKSTKILDFGCAKSGTMKSISFKTGIKPFLYDISDKYISFWNEFTEEVNCAIYKIPKDWNNKFSVITSFFSLEHIPNPVNAVKDIHGLLNENGLLYFIVPNVLVNIGDLMVNEHINHFTYDSIRYLLETNGFKVKKIDNKSYYGSIIVVAKKEINLNNTFKKEILNNKIKLEIIDIADFWKNIDKKIIEIEEEINSKRFAIYGSGFYGSLIYSKLKNKDNFQYFIDKNPHRQNVKLFGYDIVDYSRLTDDVTNIIVGLNPNSAKDIIKDMNISSNINIFYIAN